jgi:N-acetylmuramoyl-L-alanine amidase
LYRLLNSAVICCYSRGMQLKPTAFLFAAILIAGCAHKTAQVGQQLTRSGDEIVVAGQFFHTGTPVVTWMDPGGYDAYRVERRFAPWDRSDFETTRDEALENKRLHRQGTEVTSPNRYSLRFDPKSRNSTTQTALTAEQLNKVRGGGWPLELLQQRVDQFVYHYDVAGVSRNCFNTLHDNRCLSVHFMLDLDGTIYQTLDLKESAWHATKANSRSIGIEITNMGAWENDNPKSKRVLEQWYRKEPDGHTRIVFPGGAQMASSIRTPNFIARPARDEPVIATIQKTEYRMYDLTPQQYDSLIHLTATLSTIFPNLTCDYPRDEHGKLITHTLAPDEYDNYHGLLGHYHVQDNKQDPGPAFQWDKIVNGARKLQGLKPLPPGDYINNPAARDSMAAKQ